jgi:methionyl-tRNA formyltransferase
VKQTALKYDIPVLQPSSMRDETFIHQLQQLEPDIFVVVAFKILPKKVINIPKYGSVNLHSSLLPKYRGAAPINWALINGDSETGITIFQIEPKVDTGDMLLQKKIPIADTDTCLEVHDKLAVLGSESLLEALKNLAAGKVEKIPQNDDLATQAPKIYPEMGQIDWHKSAREIKNQIHGLSPFPGAYSNFADQRIKILRAQIDNTDSTEEPGTIIIRNKKSLGIQTAEGILYPTELQKAGKRAMPAQDFLNGFQGQIGDRFTQ